MVIPDLNMTPRRSQDFADVDEPEEEVQDFADVDKHEGEDAGTVIIKFSNFKQSHW